MTFWNELSTNLQLLLPLGQTEFHAVSYASCGFFQLDKLQFVNSSEPPCFSEQTPCYEEKAIMHPISKAGSKDFRLIGLLNQLAKLSERMIS